MVVTTIYRCPGYRPKDRKYKCVLFIYLLRILSNVRLLLITQLLIVDIDILLPRLES